MYNRLVDNSAFQFREDTLSQSQDRTVYVDSSETNFLQWPVAQSAETLDYFLDASAVLPDGDFVVFVAASARPSGAGELSVVSTSATSTVITVTLSGGVAGRTYSVRVDASTAAGREYSWIVGLPVSASCVGTPFTLPPDPGFGLTVTWTYPHPYTPPVTPTYPSVHGTAAYSANRTIYVTNANDVYLQWPIAESGEDLDYSVDLAPLYDKTGDSNEIIYASIAPSGAGELSIVSLNASDSELEIYLSGGVPGRTYKVRLDIVTAQGREYSLIVLLPIEKSCTPFIQPLPPSPDFGPVTVWPANGIALEGNVGFWALENGRGIWLWG